MLPARAGSKICLGNEREAPSMYLKGISHVYKHAYQMYITCLNVCQMYMRCICIADVCEAIFINPSLWASSVFGCATSPRGFAPREAAQSSPIVSWLKDAYQMYIRCISKLCYLYKPVPMSELGFWLRHLASGLRPSRNNSVESNRKLTLNFLKTHFRGRRECLNLVTCF